VKKVTTRTIAKYVIIALILAWMLGYVVPTLISAQSTECVLAGIVTLAVLFIGGLSWALRSSSRYLR
jgi:hypothetical protein